MTSPNSFSADGLGSAFDTPTWHALQRYIQDAQHLPTSPNPVIEAILQKLQTAATALNGGAVSDVQMAANGLYNYAQTMVTTLGALGQVAGSGDKTSVTELIGNLVSSLKEPMADTARTSAGLINGTNSTSGAGKALKSEAVKVSALVGAANDNAAAGTASLKSLLKADPLDPDQLDAAMADIRAAASRMSGQTFVGLAFDPSNGVAALDAARDQMSAAGRACATLKAALGSLGAQIGATPKDKIAHLPQLQPDVLSSQAQAWTEIAKDLHRFALTFSAVAE
ncbi:hypothetical protein [Pseudooctadecabacter sp.]|uniref:hypothetical protein n=1 Tax=Pseudooctadecabacter sp. TaxID=1966338 RepID=UPI0025F0429F|nr:hypothetical protein [Pseudooctadecabacter sp.]